MLSIWATTILCVFLVSGCKTEPKAVLPPLPAHSKILAFGDSLTEGYGAAEDKSYPAVLSRLTNLEVINAGVSGEITKEGRKRILGALQQYRPNLVILLHGGNDFLRKKDPDRTKQNLKAMIETCHAERVPVVLIGVPSLDILLRVPGFYEDLAEEYKLPYDGDIMRKLISEREFRSDKVHLNALGYTRLAQRIHKVLQDHGALK